MKSTASDTVRIFSASSSGISISKASSKAITSSTVSSESAPRSSTNEALGVTSPSSTPNCSTIICFTFSSTAAMFSSFLNLGIAGPGSGPAFTDLRLRVGHRIVYGSNEVETSSLKGIGKVCKGSDQERPAPKGAFDFEEFAVSLKRYPDTKPEVFSSLQKKADCVKVTKES